MRTIAVVGAAILLTTSGPSHLWAKAPPAIHRTSDQETAVKTVVAEFGKRLRMVAILAPKEMVTKAMDEEYSAFVPRICWRFGKTTLRRLLANERQVRRLSELISAQSRPRDMTPTW